MNTTRPGPTIATTPVARMNASGIGYAGLDGVWWLPAVRPFPLPQALRGQLARIGRGLFTLFDVLAALWQAPGLEGEEVRELLVRRVPLQARRQTLCTPLYFLRPDFQLYPGPDGLTPVATELEICPAAQGFAHAMQMAYELPADLLQSLVDFLDGRELLIAGAHQWSAFLFEQLALCKALSEAGARGRVLYNRPLRRIAEEVAVGERWRPPMFGISAQPSHWDGDVLARLRRRDLAAYWWPHDDTWPDNVGDAVVFRFGYVTHFDRAQHACFRRWHENGALLLNPPCFWMENKAVMATLALPQVRAALAAKDPDLPALLDHTFPETLVLNSRHVDRLMAEQDEWLLKFAGFDDREQAWGGRSLQVGKMCSREQWQLALLRALALPWPVVAQRLVPTAVVDIDYYDSDGHQKTLHRGNTRLRVFFLRDEAGTVLPCGAHVTVSAQTPAVSEATDAVQAPVVFGDRLHQPIDGGVHVS